jgi:hypothetical protein
MLTNFLLAGLGTLLLLPLLRYAGGLRKTGALVYTPTRREHIVWPFVILLAAAVVYCLATALSQFIGSA